MLQARLRVDRSFVRHTARPPAFRAPSRRSDSSPFAATRGCLDEKDVECSSLSFASERAGRGSLVISWSLQQRPSARRTGQSDPASVPYMGGPHTFPAWCGYSSGVWLSKWLGTTRTSRAWTLILLRPLLQHFIGAASVVVRCSARFRRGPRYPVAVWRIHDTPMQADA